MSARALVTARLNVVLLTPVRILAEGLAACLSEHTGICLVAAVPTLSALRERIQDTNPHLVLIDVTQGANLEEIRSIVAECPDIPFVALGLREQHQEVIRCGRAGFVGYVAREATIDVLCRAMLDATTGRLHCSAEISGGLLRALFRMERSPATADTALTRREGEVLQLIRRGLSNKEIARELNLSTATIKHHVHGVLGKLKLARRSQAIRLAQDTAWIGSSAADRLDD